MIEGFTAHCPVGIDAGAHHDHGPDPGVRGCVATNPTGRNAVGDRRLTNEKDERRCQGKDHPEIAAEARHSDAHSDNGEAENAFSVLGFPRKKLEDE